MKCPECGKELQEGSLFCNFCGAKITNKKIVEQKETKKKDNIDSSQTKVCPDCGTLCDINEPFCECGYCFKSDKERQNEIEEEKKVKEEEEKRAKEREDKELEEKERKRREEERKRKEEEERKKQEKLLAEQQEKARIEAEEKLRLEEEKRKKEQARIEEEKRKQKIEKERISKQLPLRIILGVIGCISCIASIILAHKINAYSNLFFDICFGIMALLYICTIIIKLESEPYIIHMITSLVFIIGFGSGILLPQSSSPRFFNLLISMIIYNFIILIPIANVYKITNSLKGLPIVPCVIIIMSIIYNHVSKGYSSIPSLVVLYIFAIVAIFFYIGLIVIGLDDELWPTMIFKNTCLCLLIFFSYDKLAPYTMYMLIAALVISIIYIFANAIRNGEVLAVILTFLGTSVAGWLLKYLVNFIVNLFN